MSKLMLLIVLLSAQVDAHFNGMVLGAVTSNSEKSDHGAVFMRTGGTSELPTEDRICEDMKNDWAARVESYLSGGGDPNLWCSGNWNLLMLALNADETNALRILLAFGADPRAKNSFNANAAEWAAGARRFDGLKEILDSGYSGNFGRLRKTLENHVVSKESAKYKIYEALLERVRAEAEKPALH